ncbi:bifunctional [glutamate--ammonia ligase]-adenylyl-L-tyrosine phosphorylase/[glutamate--ammonia-ligase] adenylyltransferase [Alcaligenes phenolicus]|uniref:bifunctional [glutamate--ammonia ligase]-adenylyl-L-tyrosine phosphorylase/[glutamate--ammonia-ligase] adenylyltransferase n=1 Tax=Alcaligenes phenolicus TaxID=232846 RepID=UPI000E7E1F3E|nr:bifunctional [glutamate--ammonia ligase]-adenylyl-L-tyrosine phosphorylase/[glutamate--ammonia-ligase] adenylyltransferase [Alcaligenes phenolicus]HBJ67031.1 bifunctional [glutamate--ammonia ligase]-adenylyl-L-tyrosine phosphorylase/[glutamate--ammonia-ligase] adenylyltransferase [Alcaligenes faecalis]
MSQSIILKPVMQWSGPLRRKVNAQPQFGAWLEEQAQHPVTPALITQWYRTLLPEPDNDRLAQVRQALRQLRERVFLVLMIRDINGLAPLEEVMQAMSSLADLAVAQAYETVARQLADVHGIPKNSETGLPQEMIILGMGKLGGGELNVSSDIDLIMLYDEDGETEGRRPLSYHEFYGKVTQRMMPVLSDTDAFGQVFRTDLRLRPDGDSGPLAWSMQALENYLVNQGREWERYAWIKARPIKAQAFEGSRSAGDIHHFEALRTPFVYRKYFDFDALSALRGLRERIRQDWTRRALNRNGVETWHNIKLGDGGIREIEFVVQLNQLIRGGRQPSLQTTSLHKALRGQCAAGLLDQEVCDKLLAAYTFLRRVEHRLQYREDEQTHLLPQDEELRTELAATLGLSLPDFDEQLGQHRKFVSHTFRNAFRLAGMGEEASAEPPVAAAPTLEVNSAEQDQALQERIEQLRQALLNSHRLRSLPNASLDRVQRLIPLAEDYAYRSENPEMTATRLFNLIELIAQRSAYLALLAEYPDTLARVARIVSASPWAAQYLAQYPLLLDSLIEWHSLMEIPDFAALSEQMCRDLDACRLPDGQADVEQQMNMMRDWQHQITFQLLAQDLEGVLTVEALADQLSALADMMLAETLERTWPLTRPRSLGPEHDTPPRFAVIAYGKLGGKEIGYASDLDLVFLYDDPSQDNVERYIKLARRMTSWLSAMTSSGRLYDIDLRLRPDGDAGLLAVSVDAFEQYQTRSAWSWEHQAITRARFVTGDAQIKERFDEIRRSILLMERDRRKLRADILDMRDKISAGHPNRSELFDLKHDRGGMVDVEFITQYLVLCHSREHPKLLENLGNIALLGIAAQAGLIAVDHAQEVADAYRALRRRQHALRLEGAEKARVPQTELTQERQAVTRLWDEVLGY